MSWIFNNVNINKMPTHNFSFSNERSLTFIFSLTIKQMHHKTAMFSNSISFFKTQFLKVEWKV